jgi:hypothetical protein
MKTLLCARGVTIYSVGGDRLAVELDCHGGLAKRLAAIPGVELWQNGDREKTFVFSIDLLDAVAAVVKPRRRRRCSLSPEQLRVAGERLLRHRAKYGGADGGGAAKAAREPPDDVAPATTPP